MKLMISVLLIASFAACSSSTEDTQKKQTVDAVHQPLEKAQAVEKQLLDRAAEQRKQADDL